MTTKPVEVMIKREIHARATERAEAQRTELAGVAKQIVWQAAANAEPVPNPRPYPRRIGQGVPRKRLRMIVNAEQWDNARHRIRMSSQSVARVIEDGLDTYARTGVIAAPAPMPERNLQP